ncbi:MAG TPA: mevalonate kinase [Prolixibacteraceae bacterium]
MNPIIPSFNSKLLLFGEYGLMMDAMALSVPFARFSGSLGFDTNHLYQESSLELRKFYAYLTTAKGKELHFPFDLECLADDLDNGLYFNSNIPQQYGLGSSGALVAALFSRYAAPAIPIDNLSADILKVDFAQLESHFHGKSSGLDPLVSFLNRPLLLDSKKRVQTVPLDLAHTGWSFALIDTHTRGATGPLVQHFIDLFNSTLFETAFCTQFIPANNGCIEALLKNDPSRFFSLLKQLIEFQLEFFGRMIPSNFHLLISEAVSQQVYIKLLGSGGGGFLLAIAPSEINMNKWADENEIPLLKVV